GTPVPGRDAMRPMPPGQLRRDAPAAAGGGLRYDGVGDPAPTGVPPWRGNMPQAARDRRNGRMPEVYTVRPQPVAGQQGSTLIRWLDRYAQAHAPTGTQKTRAGFHP